MTKKKNLKVTLAAFAALTAMASSQIPVQAAMYNGWSKQPSGDWNLYKGGVKTTGWQQDGGKWYYMTNSGNMLKNAWAQDSSGRWFFLGSDGAMVSNGWAQDKAGNWFYLGSDGGMVTNGWAQDSSKCWFYLGSTGEMANSQWVEYKGNMYYLNAGGDMAANTTTPDGSFVDASGARIVSGNVADLSDGGSHTGNYMITAYGTYGNADAAKVTTINGNVVINMPNATESDVINLQNLKVTGTITVNFGAGTINTNKVIGNDVKVENVGSHCFNVGPGSIFEQFAVADKNNDAKIKVDREALLKLLIVSSGGSIEAPANVASIQKIVLEQKYLNKEVTPPPVTLAGLVPQLQIAGQSNLQISQGTVLQSVSAGAGATISGPGRVGDIQLINPNITVYLNNPTIGIVDILQQATDSHVVIPSGTYVGTLNVAGRATVTGGGTIGTANVGASGTVIEPSTTHTAVTEGTTVTVGGETVTNSNSDKTIPKVPIGIGSTIDTGSGGSSGGGSSSSTVKATAVDITVAGDANTITANGGTLQLSAAVTPDNVTVEGVTWSVSDDTVASIGSTGLLTAKKNGTVIVTATSKSVSTVKDTYTVTVSGQTVIDNSKIVSSFAAVTKTLTGCVHDNDVQYQTAADVEAALPTTVTATMADGSVKTYNVIWAEKILGQYSPNTSGVCEFVGTIQLGDGESLASDTVVPKAYVAVNSTDAQPVEVSVTTEAGIAGQKLSTLTPSGVFNDASGKPLDGTLEWASGDTVLTSGTHTYTYKFTPTNTDYSVLNGGVSVTVTMPRTLEQLGSITTTGSTYPGDSISDVIPHGTFVNADGASVPGTFSWDDTDQVITSGTNTCNWTFTPSDTSVYDVVTGTVSVLAQAQAEARVSGTVSATDIYTGQKLSDSLLSVSDKFYDAGGYTLTGTLHWSSINDLTTPITDAGQKLCTWEFIPDNHAYSTIGGGVNVNVIDGAAQAPSADTSIISATVKGVAATLVSGTTYSVELPFGTDLDNWNPSTEVVVDATDDNAAVSDISASEDAVITFNVTAEDGTIATYTINVTIAAASSDTTVKKVTVTIGEDTIEAVPTSDATEYNLTVPAGTNIAALGQSFTITPNGAGAVVSGNLILVDGDHTWGFTIMAQDGRTTANYDINVTALEAAVTDKPYISGTPRQGDVKVSGTAQSGASIVLSVNDVPVAPVIADGSGNWTVTGLTLRETDVISVTAELSPSLVSDAAIVGVAAAVATYHVGGTVTAGTGDLILDALVVKLYASTDTEFSTVLSIGAVGEDGKYTFDDAVPDGTYVIRVEGDSNAREATAEVVVNGTEVTTADLTVDAAIRTETPVINGILKAGDTVISGTCVKDAQVLVNFETGEPAYATVNGTSWTITVPALVANNIVYVTAIHAPDNESDVVSKTVLATTTELYEDASYEDTVIVIGESGVAYDSSSRSFIIPSGVTSFKFTKNGVACTGEYTSYMWHFRYDVLKTATPYITGTPKAGDTTVSGTSLGDAVIALTVNGGTTVYATADQYGYWTATGLTLAEGNTIVIIATQSPNEASNAVTITVAAGISTLQTYNTSGVVTVTDTSGVEYSDGYFTIPYGITSFKFTDNDVAKTATCTDGTWSFATAPTTQAYEPSGIVIVITSGVTYYNKTFTIPNGVTSFAFTDNGVAKTATYTSGIWSFATDVVAKAELTYSSTSFAEAGMINDGSIWDIITVTLANDTFVGTNDEALTGVTVNNVPAGLTAVVTKKTSTTAEISLTGKATNHSASDSISNLTVAFANEAFTGGNASAVTNATKNDLEINFVSPIPESAFTDNSEKKAIFIYMDNALKDGSYSADGFKVVGIPGNVSLVQVDPSSMGGVDLRLSEDIPAGASFTISYDKSAATTKLIGISGDEVEDFTIQVTNNITA